MNHLTKIAALPTGGGCQSALRPEDRGGSSKTASSREMLLKVRVFASVESYVPSPAMETLVIRFETLRAGVLAIGAGGTSSSAAGKGGAC